MTKILIIEDDAIIAEDIKNRLENMNYSVSRIVSNGQDAIKSASELDIDLILMDVILQGDIDGIEAAKEIKKHFDIPVIYLTAHSDKNTLERAKVTGPFGYLIKPFEDKELQITIDIALYRHEMDSRIKYMGTHDSLTDLYNRAFFEEELLKLQKENKSHTGVIICDLDGLKLINDTLGHEKGDEALKCTAKILKENVRADDTVARIGGDKYAVLLPNISRGSIKKIYGRLKKSFDSYTFSHLNIPWSVSIGFAMNDETDGNISGAIKLAENHMYREKLSKTQSSPCTASKILKVLEIRNNDTANHLSHLDALTARFARELSLSDQRTNELRLIVKFHDICKAGIPDELSQMSLKRERRVMQRHPEICYRILNSTPQLRPVAEIILKHHEWWNGQGYPFGLKGKKIPFESRIITIIDTYDIMTSEIHYKEDFNHEKALNEIKKGSRIQFDPYLVERFIEMMKKAPETL